MARSKLRAGLIKPRGKGQINKLVDRISNLSNSSVGSGYFSEQGDHPTAGMSFVELAKIHHFGFGGFYPQMWRNSVKTFTGSRLESSVGPKLVKYLNGKSKLSTLLDFIGKQSNEAAYEVFGNDPPLDTTGNPTPLVDTGELSDNFSWKTSEGETIKSLPNRNNKK